MLLPVVFLGMLVSAQPAIALYDRLVMQSAAAEGCRVLETLAEGQEDTARAYVERRLQAVPQVDIFHVGSWEIELSGAGQQDDEVSVKITHAFKPLPLVAVGLNVTGFADDSGMVVQSAVKTERLRDAWLLKSEFASNYGDWLNRWDDHI